MKTPALRPLALGAAAIAVTLMLLGRAQAGDDDFYPPVTDPLTVQECASCHIAFPASMLPAASWRRMMGELENHFGDDASVDADTTAAITRYLVDHASRCVAYLRRMKGGTLYTVNYALDSGVEVDNLAERWLDLEPFE